VLKSPSEPDKLLVKRVLALSGSPFRVYIPTGHAWIRGDNRGATQDSQTHWGAVPLGLFKVNPPPRMQRRRLWTEPLYRVKWCVCCGHRRERKWCSGNLCQLRGNSLIDAPVRQPCSTETVIILQHAVGPGVQRSVAVIHNSVVVPVCKRLPLTVACCVQNPWVKWQQPRPLTLSQQLQNGMTCGRGVRQRTALQQRHGGCGRARARTCFKFCRQPTSKHCSEAVRARQAGITADGDSAHVDAKVVDDAPAIEVVHKLNGRDIPRGYKYVKAREKTN
jgi:hypothetical protein